MALAFANIDTQNQLPLYAKVISPSYIGVALFGLPLEATGIGDTIAYTAAFGLNSVFLGIIIIFIIKWLRKKA